MGAIQKVQLDVERVLAILESSRDIEELRVAKGMADVALAAARASSAVRANAQVIALCESADLRYRRALGEILARMPKAEGGQPYQATGHSSGPVATSLADLGITKNESSQCQRLASLPAPAAPAPGRGRGRRQRNRGPTRQSGSPGPRVSRIKTTPCRLTVRPRIRSALGTSARATHRGAQQPPRGSPRRRRRRR